MSSSTGDEELDDEVRLMLNAGHMIQSLRECDRTSSLISTGYKPMVYLLKALEIVYDTHILQASALRISSS